jgi:polyhydroxyalkanoate synthesis regulator phasin
MAKDWLDEIIKAVKRNEGKLPNQVSKDLQKNMKTLGIVVPKQGPPSY